MKRKAIIFYICNFYLITFYMIVDRVIKIPAKLIINYIFLNNFILGLFFSFLKQFLKYKDKASNTATGASPP